MQRRIELWRMYRLVRWIMGGMPKCRVSSWSWKGLGRGQDELVLPLGNIDDVLIQELTSDKYYGACAPPGAWNHRITIVAMTVSALVLLIFAE